jgi:hypothetical protein
MSPDLADPRERQVSTHDKTSRGSAPHRGAATTAVVLLVVLAQFLCVSHVSAQIDPDERRIFYAATTVPVDEGHGNVGGAGFFYWNRPKWPCDDTQFRLVFAGVYLDTLLTWPQLLGKNTSFNVGASALGFFDGLTEYRDGEDLDEQKFYGDTASVRTFVEREVFKLWDEIPFNIKLEYELRGTQYREASTTDPTFVLPHDGYTQVAELRFALGGIRPGIVRIEGAELFLTTSAAWRGNWRPWGLAGAPFETSNRYQKIMAGAGVLLGMDRFVPSLKKHYFGVRLSGGYGNRLDRLSQYKLGGSLPTGAESTTVHGFYARELFASDFFLTNLSYEVPLADWHELAGHVYADYAAVKRKDIADHGWKGYGGLGAGVSAQWWKTDVLLTYGFGINAERLGHRGGHEIALQMFKTW